MIFQPIGFSMRNALFAVFLASVVSGCATLTPQLGFDDVRQAVTARTGQQIHWRASAEDRKIEEAVSELLQSPLTAETATQIALFNNRRLQALYQELGIAQADLVEAGLLPNPIVGGEVRFPSAGTAVELSVVQNFIGLLKIPQRRKAAASRFEEAKIDVIDQVLDLLYEVRSGYYRCQAAEQMLKASDSALAAQEASRDLASELRRAGNISALDDLREQLNYATLLAEVAAEKEQLLACKEALSSHLGLEETQTAWQFIPEMPQPAAFLLKAEEALEQALASSLALAKSQQHLQTLAAEAGIADTFAWMEEAELGAAAEREPGDDWGFGPAFSLPLPLFNHGQTQVYRARAALAQQHELNIDLKRRLRLRIATLIERHGLLAGRLQRRRETILPLHEKLVQESRKRHAAMLLGAFDLLAFRREQIEAEKDYLADLRDYWLLRTELESALHGHLPGMTMGEKSK